MYLSIPYLYYSYIVITLCLLSESTVIVIGLVELFLEGGDYMPDDTQKNQATQPHPHQDRIDELDKKVQNGEQLSEEEEKEMNELLRDGGAEGSSAQNQQTREEQAN